MLPAIAKETTQHAGARDGRVILVSPRGYCAGVDRAITTVERALARSDSAVHVRKEIVHNKYVVAALRAQGAVFVDEVDEVPPGGVVVFSAHGVSPAVRAAAAARGLVTIDATCPLVTKVHKEAQRLAAAGQEILLIGHAGHEEVEGTFGEAPHAIHLVEHPDDAERVAVRDPARLAWLSQTTLSVDETRETVTRLRARFPALADPPSEDICYATQNRQGAVREVAPACDCVLVVGSANSSNSRRLVEVALDAGAGAAYLIDAVADIDPAWLGCHTVGVTSGASVPDYLVQDVVAHLQENGFPEVIEHQAAEETLTFALPPAVR
ncbi:MAG: 4-hydroxy-3-methylbut-2-enyl diphosphate reductase [Propionibacteriaceae bacterium]|jgi:4-hydroxy-3-methylbut-2-enyl diphosphate reductase|nr:4-hydroxy-3-methylbut-2-enyl diphosphate reductase [Propionibacteriaceae bacterium]